MAGSTGSFRQLESKPCAAEIQCMKWSSKMDLLAVVTVEGEVWLHRLSWKRVWSIPSTEGRAVVLAWRPDGKVLAVGYSDGTIKLYDIENADCIHKFDIGAKPSCMDWMEGETQKSEDGDENLSQFFVEKSQLYLPPLPHLPKTGGAVFSKETSQEETTDPKKLKSLGNEINILVIGDGSGRIHMFLYGIFLCGTVDTLNSNGDEEASCEVVSATLSKNMQALCTVVQSSQKESNRLLNLMLFDTTILASRHAELSVIAKKQGVLATLMEYFDNAMRSMSDAWEDILLEMSTKLTTFAAERRAVGSNVSAEFLALLTQGTASPEMQAFLLHELTEKGLKKLGHSIDNSYSSIQSLSLKHLQSVTEALLYHLTELLGMSKWYDHFGVLGFAESTIQEALKSLGSLMLKTQELVQVIESSLMSFKAFFQWLYSVILYLSDDPVPSWVKQFSQRDITLVAEFLQDQLSVNEQGKFTLERVGQYFEDKPLPVKSDFGSNAWTDFVGASPQLKSSPLLIPHEANESLLTLSRKLHRAVDIVFARPACIISELLLCWSNTPLCEVGAEEAKSFTVSQLSFGHPSKQYLVFPGGEENSNKLHLVRAKTDKEQPPFVEAATVFIKQLAEEDENSSGDGPYRVLDAMFYNSETISVLLNQEETQSSEKLTVLAQIPVAEIKEEFFAELANEELKQGACSLTSESKLLSHDIGASITHFRRLPGMHGQSLAVSGTRKVSCVLASSRRRVQLFDMDAEDDETEDLEMSQDVED